MIKKNMIHALRCFRDHKETILICLEVFINEPTLDWLRKSKINSIGNAEDESSVNSIWNPEVRIDIVKRKLNGANPTKTLIDELNSDHMKTNAALFNAYKAMIAGNDDCMRSKLMGNEDNLTVEEQVACLTELATDEAILATTYIGWDSWL